MATIRDVAERAGVSIATVSYVLNESASVRPETRERVLAAAEELAYRPNINARSLQAQRSHIVGYSWHYTPPDQINPILDRFLHRLGHAAAARDYHVLASPVRGVEEELAAYAEFINTRRVDGFVLSATNLHDPRIAYLLAQRFPFVAFGRANPDWDFPWVDVDGAAGMRAATEHLLALGHRRIAFVGWQGVSVAGHARRHGYHATMLSAGLEPDENLISQSHEDGYATAQNLLHRAAGRRPSAFVCVSDVIAIGAMNGALDLGVRIPDDVAISGFDDAPMAQYLRPSLTTLRQPIDEVGELVMTMLLRLIDGEALSAEERHRLLEPRLVVRRSTDPSARAVEED